MQQIVSFYKPLQEGVQAQIKYQQTILSKGDDKYLASLRAAGYETGVPMYMRGDAIEETPDKTHVPQQNQAAYNAGDWQNISANKKSWFLLDSKGNRILALANQTPHRWMMDWGNKEWQQFWRDRASAAIAAGKYAGVFIDNTEASLAKRQSVGPIPAKYPTDLTYQQAVKSFLIFVKAGISPVNCNVISARSNDAFAFYLTTIDGAMDECWSVDWHGYYSNVTKWQNDLDLVIKNPSKRIICVAQGDKADTQKQLFSFASYLLANQGSANFRYSNYDNYNESWWFSNYEAQLGNAHSDIMRNGAWYFRLYQGGYVEVDPVTHAANIVCS